MMPLLWTALLLVPAADPRPPEHVIRYRTRCAAIRVAEVGNLVGQVSKGSRESNSQAKQQGAAAAEELKRLNTRPLPLAPLPLPPRQDDMGIFLPAAEQDGRVGHSVDVLEVVDADEAIVRAWYVPILPDAAKTDPPEDPTFIDVWVQGIDTSNFTAGMPATLAQVFHVSGSKSFGTTCGGRSMPLIEAFDFEPFRAVGEPTPQPAPVK